MFSYTKRYTSMWKLSREEYWGLAIDGRAERLGTDRSPLTTTSSNR